MSDVHAGDAVGLCADGRDSHGRAAPPLPHALRHTLELSVPLANQSEYCATLVPRVRRAVVCRASAQRGEGTVVYKGDMTHVVMFTWPHFLEHG